MTVPQPTAPAPYSASVPVGGTSRRLDWDLLPPPVRRLVEDRLGGRVVAAESAGAGFTPGFASTLTTDDGRRVFVKAASTRAQRTFADAYREEVRKLRALPPGLPVPRLLWSHEDDLWVVHALEHVDGRNPGRPWAGDDLDACLDALELLADALTPSPLTLDTFADDFADAVRSWDHVRRTLPDLPHTDEAEALARRIGDATAGTTLVHTDGRDDNFLLAGGRAVLCDWNWPVVGAAWIDTVALLVGPAGDGVDVDAVLARRRLTRDVDPEDIDVFLAVVAGYFLEHRDRPVPNSSPWIRAHQDWYAEATWGWLSRRRGWA